jgi:hypothetical protein
MNPSVVEVAKVEFPDVHIRLELSEPSIVDDIALEENIIDEENDVVRLGERLLTISVEDIVDGVLAPDERDGLVPVIDPWV